MEAPAELRARFGYGPERPCAAADGVPLRAGQLSCRSLNFGRWNFTEGLARAAYTAEVPVAYLREVMEREHPQYVADSLRWPEADDALEQELRARGWPPVADVIDDAEVLPLVLDLYAHDLLVRWLGDGQPPELPGWVANTLERMERRGDVLLLGGTALEAGR